MHKSELKKIFYDFSFIKEPMSILKILDTITVNPTESMKHILCRMQNNEDLDFIFNEVIKLIDTRVNILKFYTNLYLKVYTKNNPIRQLLCVNTFLKDLSDKSDVIKKSTLKVIESIKDEVILSNYKNKIKNTKNESKEIKIQKLMIMSEIEIEIEDLNEFIKSGDPEMNYKGIEKMCDIIVCNLKGGGLSKVGGKSKVGENTHLNNPHTHTPSHTPSLSNPLTLSKPLNNPPSHSLNTPHLNTPILDLINRNLNNPKSLYFLIKLAYLKNLQISPCLHFNYLPLFFYSSLISNDKQSIYNSSLLFLKSSYEKIYHILLFQESLLDFVDYENSNYLIYEEDPFYIKTQKVKMLFYKLDDISIYELTRQSKGELREVILENGIKKGCIIEGVLYEDMGGCGSRVDKGGLSKGKGFRNLPSSNPLPSTNTHNTHNSIINILFNNFPFSLNYSYLIKNYLLTINPLTLNQDSFKKYLYLVGKVCDDYEIIDINEIRDINLITPILKFYISFFKRKILSEEKFIEIIRGLKKKEKFKEKAKVLLNLINLKGPYVLFDFEEEGMYGKDEGGNKVKLEIYEEKIEEGVDCGGSKVDNFKDIGQ
jgi:hypothetical protein